MSTALKLQLLFDPIYSRRDMKTYFYGQKGTTTYDISQQHCPSVRVSESCTEHAQKK